MVQLDKQTKRNTHRPIAITIICVIGFIGAVLALPMIFSQPSKDLGSFYQVYLGFSTCVGIVSMIGLWKMKRWAVMLYSGFVLLNQVILISMNTWNFMAILIPGIFIGISLFYVKMMD
ncbi:MAG: hypothetical protein JST20_11620 [Bacteroidetes bacterium]|nr:hypothetical protein [Bacteroidota bacterium]